MAKKKIQLKSGDVLFRLGDLPDSAYLIESGFMEVSAIQDGRKVILGNLRKGEIVGEMAVIDSNPRTATVIATSDCTLIAIDRDQFAERLANSDTIVRSLLDGLIRRYRDSIAHLRGELAEVDPFRDTTMLKTLTVSKIRLESQLKTALEEEQLNVIFQPIYDNENEKTAGYEALIRWNHPEQGMMSPADFITIAEETSLIADVGAYAIESSCKALRQLMDAGADSDIFISVNVSTKQINDENFIDNINQCIKEHNLDNTQLVIEITESHAAKAENLTSFIRKCHINNYRVSLDDFGTGYSNLSQLYTMSYDTIKIDKAFTRNIEYSPKTFQFLNSLVEMSHSLDAATLIEGIETQEQFAKVKELGCKYTQGYLIGAPMDIQEILENQKSQ